MPSKTSIKIIVSLLLCTLIVPIPGLAYRYNLNPGEEVCEEGATPSVFYCNCPQSITPENLEKIQSFIADKKLVILGDKKYLPWYDNFLCPFTKKLGEELNKESIKAKKPKTEPTTEMFYIHSDHLGGTSVVTNDDGEVVQTLDYYPYGDTRIDDPIGDFESSRKFTGQEEDPESDLYYFNARYYDPNIGRFTQQDPVFNEIGSEKFYELIDQNYQNKDNKEILQKYLANPQNLNSYSYVSNNPLLYVDPTGNLRVNTKGASEEEIQTFNEALGQLQVDVANNQELQDYFQLFDIDINEVLTNDDEGPEVNLGGWHRKWDKGKEKILGRYRALNNDIYLYDKVFESAESIAYTLVHELGHWVNDVGKFFGTLNPNVSGLTDNSGKNLKIRIKELVGLTEVIKDGFYGYLPELILYNKIY